MEIKRFRNQSHWGAFWAEVLNGRVVGVKPFELDQNPSPLIASIPGATHANNRVSSPMVRKMGMHMPMTTTSTNSRYQQYARIILVQVNVIDVCLPVEFGWNGIGV